jgi:hypothetical protein
VLNGYFPTGNLCPARHDRRFDGPPGGAGLTPSNPSEPAFHTDMAAGRQGWDPAGATCPLHTRRIGREGDDAPREAGSPWPRLSPRTLHRPTLPHLNTEVYTKLPRRISGKPGVADPPFNCPFRFRRQHPLGRGLRASSSIPQGRAGRHAVTAFRRAEGGLPAFGARLSQDSPLGLHSTRGFETRQAGLAGPWRLTGASPKSWAKQHPKSASGRWHSPRRARSLHPLHPSHAPVAIG